VFAVLVFVVAGLLPALRQLAGLALMSRVVFWLFWLPSTTVVSFTRFSPAFCPASKQVHWSWRKIKKLQAKRLATRLKGHNGQKVKEEKKIGHNMAYKIHRGKN
jgi:hypothetical protein